MSYNTINIYKTQIIPKKIMHTLTSSTSEPLCTSTLIDIVAQVLTGSRIETWIRHTRICRFTSWSSEPNWTCTLVVVVTKILTGSRIETWIRRTWIRCLRVTQIKTNNTHSYEVVKVWHVKN